MGQALLSAIAHAQTRNLLPTPDDTQELRVIESTEQGEDPLGIDRATGADLDEAAERIAAIQAVAPLPVPTRGAVVSGLRQVRETNHALRIRLEQGLAFVEVRIGLESRAKHSSEVAYRLALPEEAVLVGLSACPSKGPCLQAAPVEGEAGSAQQAYRTWLAGSNEARGPALSLWAEPILDHRGPALALRVAPLPPDGKLELQVRYVVEAMMRGGRVHLHLPARGEDPRLAPNSQVQISAPGFLPLALPDLFSWDARLPLDSTAEWPTGQAAKPVVTQARCGRGRCVRRYGAFGKASPKSRPTWLWIDASPSMEGPARSRADVVLAALLAQLPGDTPLSAHAFAARAMDLGRFSADGAPLALLGDATMLDLGSATRPSVVVAQTLREIAKTRPRIVILSDGLIDGHPDQRRALTQARERGAELWLLSLHRAPETLGDVIEILDLTEEADRALKSGDLSELGDALSITLSAQARPGVRYGEQSVSERGPEQPYPLAASDHWLAFWWARTQRPAPKWFGASGVASAPVIAALPYLDAPPEPAPTYSAMPAESVLELLRTQLVPKARACLRSDRRGRGDYAVALSFRALFSRREVSEVSIEGKIPEHLRACLAELLPKLRVPAFSGSVRVRYPIHTDREPPPPVVEMTPEISESVRRVMAAPLGRP